MTVDPANPAPGRLRLVQLFVNTADRYGGHDALREPQQAAAWLTQHHLLQPGCEITWPALTELHHLRDALRDLAAANSSARTAPAEAITTFNRTARAHPSIVTLRTDEHGGVHTSLAPYDTDATAVAVASHLVAAVHEAVLTGTWPRLKSCASPDCRWLFYDTSRSRTGRWCSMAACGSIHKARAYRRRHAAQ